MRGSFVAAGIAGTALILTSTATAREGAVEVREMRSFLRGSIGLSEAQVAAVEAGQVVTRQLPTTDKPEMAAFGAVRVDADKEVYLRRLRDVARFRRNRATLQIGVFGRAPSAADLEGLTLEDGDFEAARRCRPGDCDIKMARSAMERVRAEMDWSAPDARARATALMRRMLAEYAAAYVKGGTAEMATYHDKDRPLELPAEFHKVLGASPYLMEYVPEFHRYVEEFPAGRLADVEDFFYWTKDKFGPKPTISLFHLTVWKDPADPGRAVVATKQFYGSHYFQVGLDLTALLDAGPGRFYLLELWRRRIDPPTGMLSGLLLGKIRAGIEQGVAESVRSAKARTEAP